MGMFDTVSVVNLGDKNYKHNGVHFQTKRLECNAGEYVIFNGQLWHQYNGETNERYENAVPHAFSGVLKIYTDYTSGDRSYWIEYNLNLDAGKVMSVECVEERLIADRSDKSGLRPSPKSTSACITLDFRGVDGDIYDAFHADLDNRLSKLREVLGDRKAEIAYQVRSPATGPLSYGPPARWLHSVVQDLSDFQSLKPGEVSQRDSTGNSLTIFLDEFHSSKQVGKL